MNTYTLTEIELQPKVATIGMLSNMEDGVFYIVNHIDGDLLFKGGSYDECYQWVVDHEYDLAEWKRVIVKTGAKKEDIPVLADEKSLGEAWDKESDERWSSFLKEKEDIQPVPSIENYGASDNIRELLTVWKSHLRIYDNFDDTCKNLNWNHTAQSAFMAKQQLVDCINQLEEAMLNSDKNVQASDTTEADSSNVPDPQNTTKEPVIDNLRDKFFKECTKDVEPGKYSLGIKKVDMAPHDLFEWFAPYLKSNSEPVIDWEAKCKTAIQKALDIQDEEQNLSASPLKMLTMVNQILQEALCPNK